MDRKSNNKQPCQLTIGGEELYKVLSYYGLVNDSRLEQKIVCPFHEDVNPSMKVNLEEGTYFCFGCGESGDALQFVLSLVSKYHRKLNELQACKLYFEILRSKEVHKLTVHARIRPKNAPRQCLVEAEDYYYGLSITDWENGNSEEITRCKEYMGKRGFHSKILQEAGAKVTYDPYYPIVFPILDNGKFQGWVERTDNKRVEKIRKYLYNDGFQKNQTLAGNYSKTKVVVLCEGYMDMLKLHMLGYQKVAAILGWHISDIQVEKLKGQGVEHIISALDKDECGEKGTEYLKKFFRVTRFQYPKGIKDPGELDRKLFQVADQKTKELYRKDKRKRDGRNQSRRKKKGEQ